MGRPRNVKPLPSGTNRRNFLKGSLAASSAPLLFSAAGHAIAKQPEVPVFQHGVASGDPLADRVIL